jgi:hypothetical protein
VLHDTVPTSLVTHNQAVEYELAVESFTAVLPALVAGTLHEKSLTLCSVCAQYLNGKFLSGTWKTYDCETLACRLKLTPL